jgi:hypothetical protein
MEISPIDLIQLIKTSVIFGALMGVFNDLQGFIRAVFFMKNEDTSDVDRSRNVSREDWGRRISDITFRIFIFIQDVAFFVLFGSGIAIINYYYNNGRFRIYAPLASILGFIIYRFTLGRVWKKVCRSIAFAMRRGLLIFFSFLFKPMIYILTLIGISVKKFIIIIVKTIAKKLIILYNKSMVRRVMKKASVGFVEPIESCIRGNKDGR